jgi:hypothetical protein
MFTEGTLTEKQKRGVIVCIPKTARPTHTQDYRPITLLNNDYKTLARILAGRLRPVVGVLLHPSQYCGVQGKTIFGAAATVWDAIAYAEVTKRTLRVLSLDFREPFDRISHTYLFGILRSYVFSDHFVERINKCTPMWGPWSKSTDTYPAQLRSDAQ